MSGWGWVLASWVGTAIVARAWIVFDDRRRRREMRRWNAGRLSIGLTVSDPEEFARRMGLAGVSR